MSGTILVAYGTKHGSTREVAYAVAETLEESRAQLVKALAKVPEVDPYAVAVFGGVIDPRSLRFPFNRLPASDARNWSEIRAWATDVAGTFDFGKAASDARDPRSELQQTPR